MLTVGYTASSDLNTTNPFYGFRGVSDGLIVMLHPENGYLRAVNLILEGTSVFATYFGGSAADTLTNFALDSQKYKMYCV